MNETKSPYMQQSRHDDGKDLISRADAVEAIIKRLQDWVCYSNKEYRRGLYECKDIIHALPSVSAERSGEWQRKLAHYTDGSHGYILKCSVCEEEWLSETNYCPNCGAKMKGGNE